MIFGKIIMSENVVENVNETEDKVYEIPDFIIEYYKKCVTVNGNINGIRTKLFSTPEIEEWFSKQIYNKKIILKFCKNGMTSFSIIRCKNCGKQLTEKQIVNGGHTELPRFCCMKCASSSEAFREKYKQTCLEKYGVENISQLAEIKEKKKQTTFEHYGVDSYAKTKEYKERVKQTNLEKYGVESYVQTKEYKERVKQTNLEKYGVDSYTKTKEYKERVKKANLEKYGVEWSLQAKEVREKAKKTCLEKYGVTSPSQVEVFKKKAKETTFERYGVDSYTKTKEYKERARKTSLERYGTENPSQSKEVQERVKQTCLEKYGVEYAAQADEVKENIKKACLEKYGVESSLQVKEFREKGKKTSLERYGTENPSQSGVVKDKIRQTCLEKYGVEYAAQADEVKENIKKACLEKYGVEYAAQADEVKENIKKACLEKYGVESSLQVKEFREKGKKTYRSNYWDTFVTILNERKIAPLFSKKEYVSNKDNRERKFKFKCLICNEEFVSEGIVKDIAHNRESRLSAKRIFCPHCFKARYSKGEKEVVSFVKSIYGGEILENHKGLFPSHKQMELDIFLPALNLGIEFDGTYWHSDKFLRNIENDKMKNQLCEEKGIRLIRVKEEDWANNREQVEKQIREVIEELMNN